MDEEWKCPLCGAAKAPGPAFCSEHEAFTPIRLPLDEVIRRPGDPGYWPVSEETMRRIAEVEGAMWFAPLSGYAEFTPISVRSYTMPRGRAR